MVRGRLQQQEKSGDFLIYQGPLRRGLPAVFLTPPSGRRETPPSCPQLRRVSGTDRGYLPVGVTTREVERRVEAGWGEGKIRSRPPRQRAVAGIRAMVEVWRLVGWAQLGPRSSGRLACSVFSTLDSARASPAL